MQGKARLAERLANGILLHFRDKIVQLNRLLGFFVLKRVQTNRHIIDDFRPELVVSDGEAISNGRLVFIVLIEEATALIKRRLVVAHSPIIRIHKPSVDYHISSCLEVVGGRVA